MWRGVWWVGEGGVDVFTRVFFISPQRCWSGSGGEAWLRRGRDRSCSQSPCDRGADFIGTGRWRGEELRASWRFSGNWEVTLSRYKDDLSRAATRGRVGADEPPRSCVSGSEASRRGSRDGLQTEICMKYVSFSPRARAKPRMRHAPATPAFPFFMR